MGFLSLLREALSAIAANRSRTALTLMGIIIGVGAVITVVGVGDGAKIVIGDLLGSFGSRTLLVVPNETAIRNSQRRYRYEEITREDISAINAEADAVKAVTPQITLEVLASYGGRNEDVQIMGTLHHYLAAENLSLERGRFLIPEDDLYLRKVGVLGAKIAGTLFGDEDPLGRFVRIETFEMEVVGVLEEEKASFISTVSEIDTSNNNMIFVPASTIGRITGSSMIYFLIGEAVDEDSIDTAKRQIMAILNANHGKWDGQHEKFAIQELGAVLETVNTATGTLTGFISVIAGIALLVAGIGIMNIMLVSVKERTREIGTRKALGAKQSSILNQFVLETLILCGGGGLIGVGLAATCVTIIAQLSSWPALISWSAVRLSVILSLLTGMVFGLYPASRAARLDPVDALRYE
jgi:putative ABC transport system permease protein